MSWITGWLEAHPAPRRQIRPKSAELSYSHVRVYLDCPWLYRLRYVDFRRTKLHPSASLGLTIHRALEAFHRKDGSELDALLDLYEENWVHAGFSTAVEQMEWHRKGRRILETYFKEEEGRRSEIVSVEREFLFPLGPHQVRGMIDRIDRAPDGGYEVIDYKTHLDFESESEAAENLQLRIYGLGARESLGIEPKTLTLYYVAAPKKVSVPYDPSKEEEVLALLERVADHVVTGKHFKPDTSHCPSCEFKDKCLHSIAK